MNIGNFSFYFFFLMFCISFTRSNQRQALPQRRLLLAPMVVGIIMFDPLFIRLISRFAARPDRSIDIIGLWQFGQTFFHILQPLYLAAGIVILVRYSLSRRRILQITLSIGFVDLLVIAMATMFYGLFIGHPHLLMIPTLVFPYARDAVLDISDRLPLIQLLPFVQLVVLSILIFATVRYWKLTSTDSRLHHHIRRSLHVASIGNRVMGHAVKNYLFAIESEIRFMMEFADGTPPQVVEHLERTRAICDEANDRLRRTNDLLDVRKLDLEPTPLQAAVADAIASFSAGHSEVRVDVRSQAQETMVYMDRRHFSEVLSNILQNAEQACNEAGIPPEVTVSSSADSRWASVEICDNGPGFDVDILGRVFEPFFTGRNPRTNWGVGLAYCYQVVSAHDGRIDVANKPGGGARVTINLPLI